MVPCGVAEGHIALVLQVSIKQSNEENVGIQLPSFMNQRNRPSRATPQLIGPTKENRARNIRGPLGPPWAHLGPLGAPWGPLGPLGTTWGPLGPSKLLWLGWLACCAQPWLGLAWACLACLALAWSSNNNRPPSAAGGGFAAAVVVAGPGQGKAGKTGPGQTKPRQGTTGKPAKPKQDFGVP